MSPRKLTPEEQQERETLRAKAGAFAQWLGKRTSYRPEEVPPGLEMENDQRSRLEVLDFIAEPPEKYFAYIWADGSPAGRIESVRTWAGDTLSSAILWEGNDYRDNFGGKRCAFRFEAINGFAYSGIYYKSAGSYCRLKRIKQSPSPSRQFRTRERHLRSCLFLPYRSGPRFALSLWDTYQRDSLGKSRLAYRLTQCESGKRPRVLFDGADFSCALGHAIDSDACVESLMGFLCLRPGDTDDEYFTNYTPAQKEFCEQHAETLSGEVQARFCDENGNVKEGKR